MRTLRWSALATLLALTATGTAIAAEAKFLPGNAKETFKGTSGAMTLKIKGGATISCKKSETTGELLSTTKAVGTTTFSECTSGGLAINSKGAASGTIVDLWLYLACRISGLPRDYCEKYREDVFTQLEIPAAKATLETQGGFIAELEPGEKKAETFTLTAKQKEGKQEFETTEEEKEPTSLKVSTNGGAFVQSGIELEKSTLEFAKGKAQEMME
jgi:hypothetical protein